jgi:hypothetical protein
VSRPTGRPSVKTTRVTVSVTNLGIDSGQSTSAIEAVGLRVGLVGKILLATHTNGTFSTNTLTFASHIGVHLTHRRAPHTRVHLR